MRYNLLFIKGLQPENWTENPCVGGSNPPLPITQDTENKELTKADTPKPESTKQNLAQILFSKVENDPELKIIIERWSELSVELRRAIVKMIE